MADMIYVSTCKNKANAEIRVRELRKDSYNGIGMFGGYTRYVVKGRKIFCFDGWC